MGGNRGVEASLLHSGDVLVKKGIAVHGCDKGQEKGVAFIALKADPDLNGSISPEVKGYLITQVRKQAMRRGIHIRSWPDGWQPDD